MSLSRMHVPLMHVPPIYSYPYQGTENTLIPTSSCIPTNTCNPILRVLCAQCALHLQRVLRLQCIRLIWLGWSLRTGWDK